MTATGQFSCGLILLAAGASTRMGRPKQLLPVGDQPLLRQVVAAALRAPVAPVVVVLGANAAQIEPCLDGLPVQVALNPGWAEGMGSSLRAGIDALVSCAPTGDGVIIALADQPELPTGHFAKLIEAQRLTGRSIVASECAGVRGPPVLFAVRYLPALRALPGDAGARSLLQANAHEVATVPLPTALDLDTPADYAVYLSRQPPGA